MTNPSLPNDFLELSNDASEAATEDSHATENQVSLHSDADPVSDPGSSFSGADSDGQVSASSSPSAQATSDRIVLPESTSHQDTGGHTCLLSRRQAAVMETRLTRQAVVMVIQLIALLRLQHLHHSSQQNR